MIDLKNIAKVTGGVCVIASDSDSGALDDVHEDWLNEAGFEDWKRSEKPTYLGLWPEHEHVYLQFSKSSRGDLIWVVKVFGKEGDLFGKTAVAIKPATAVRDLTRLRLEIEKLDIMMMRVSKLYK